jgi:hypothetical protein
MTYRTPSPSLIDSVGHSGTQAPQAMQSSRIFMVMMVSPIKEFVATIKLSYATPGVN